PPRQYLWLDHGTSVPVQARRAGQATGRTSPPPPGRETPRCDESPAGCYASAIADTTDVRAARRAGVVNAEVDGSDEAEGKDPPRVVDDLHRLAEPEVLGGGGRRVHGNLARAARQVPGRDRETPQRRVAGDVNTDARQFPVPDDLAVTAHQG